MTRGCPQGSVLGPIFWIIIFNMVLKMLKRKRIKSVNYADDEIVVIEGNSKQKIERAGEGAGPDSSCTEKAEDRTLTRKMYYRNGI